LKEHCPIQTQKTPYQTTLTNTGLPGAYMKKRKYMDINGKNKKKKNQQKKKEKPTKSASGNGGRWCRKKLKCTWQRFLYEIMIPEGLSVTTRPNARVYAGCYRNEQACTCLFVAKPPRIRCKTRAVLKKVGTGMREQRPAQGLIISSPKQQGRPRYPDRHLRTEVDDPPWPLIP